MVILDMSKKDWFVDWFDTSYYHLLYQNRDEQEAERFIKNLMDFLDLPVESKLLDLACGKGRHSIYLNKLGYQVTGVDLSENSIAIANESSNETLQFITHDMREPRNETYDAVFNLFTSFGYFEDSNEDLKCIDNISNALKSGGFFIQDYIISGQKQI